MDNNLNFVYVVTTLRDGRKIWEKIGVAFTNSDGSLNVKLNAFPVNGECHIRPANSKNEQYNNPRYNPDDSFDPVDDWDNPFG